MLTESESQANPVTPTRHWLLVLLLLLCLGLVGYGQLLEPGKVPYSKHSDNIAYNLASKRVLYDSVRRGDGVPLWRSYQLSGGPALTQPQAMYTYPFHFLFWLLPPEAALGWVIWLHLLLAGVVWFWVGGILGLGLAARVFMAISALFSCKLILAVYAGWLPLLPGFVLAPLLIAVVFDAILRPRWQSALWMALAGGICLHTGHLQVVFYVVLCVSFYLLYQFYIWWKEGRAKLAAWVVCWLGCGALVAVGMTLYLLVPLAFDASLTTRGALDYQQFLAGHSSSPKSLWTMLFPEFLGSPLDGTYAPIELWEDLAYFGLIPLLFACIGMIAGRDRRFVRFFAMCFGFSLLLSFDSALLHFCYSYIPGFHVFRLPVRWLFVAWIWCLLLAGVGCEVLWVRWRELPGWRLGLLCALLLCVVVEGTWYSRRYIAMASASKVMPKPAYQRWFARQGKHFRIAPMGRATINPGWAAGMGLSLISGYEPFGYRHYQQYISLLQRGRVVPRRGAVWTDIRGIARFDLLDMLGVKYIVSPAPLPQLPKGTFDLVASWPRQPMFMLYGGIRRLPLYIYQNRRAKSRLYWVDSTIDVRDQAGMIRQMERQSLVGKAVVRWPSRQREMPLKASSQKTVVTGSLSQKTVVTGSLSQKTVVTGSLSQQTVVTGPLSHKTVVTGPLSHKTVVTGPLSHKTVVRGSSSQQTVAAATVPHLVYARGGALMAMVRTQRRRFLVISEVWHPGWEARIDGRVVPLAQTNLAMLGLWVPPGVHQVALSFRPGGWPWALWSSFFAMALCLLLICVALWYSWRKSSSGGATAAISAAT